MRHSKVPLMIWVCPLVLMVACVMPAMAQNAPESASAEQKSTGLEEVIVTARKRNERLQDVPVAVTAFTSQDLERYATQSAKDVASETPQLVIGASSGPGGMVVSLRGVGAAANTPSVDQQVSINIDGLQMSQTNSLQLGLYDLERVEVLKGPQALFFGKNSPGGIVSLISADPGDRLEWRLRTGYEAEANGKSVEGMISAPLTDTMGVRLVAAATDQDGWFRNIATAIPGGQGASLNTSPKQKEYFARGTLVFKAPGGGFDAKLKLAYGDQKREAGIAAMTQVLSCPLGVPQNTLGLPGAPSDCKIDRNIVDSDLSPGAVATYPAFYGNGRPFQNIHQFVAALTMNLKVADALNLTSVSGYIDSTDTFVGNASGGIVERIIFAGVTKQKQLTQELRLASSYSSPLNFMVGAFYEHGDLYVDTPITFGAGLAGPTPVLFADDAFTQKDSAYSVFGQLMWKFSPKWEVTGGARDSHEQKSQTGVRLPSLLSGFTTVPFPFTNPKVSFNNVSPEVTLNYLPAQNLTLYGAYRQGFTSGGFNLTPLAYSTAAPNNDSFNQATVQGGELGAKGTLADRRVQFDFNLYHYHYKNLQLASFDPTTLGISIKSAGTATIQGVEVGTTVRPSQLEGLKLRTAIAYNEATYGSYPNAGCYTGQTQAEGCNGNIIGGVASSQDLSGRQIVRAPKWGLNVGGSYEVPVASGVRLGISAEENYKSSYSPELENDPQARQRSSWVLNANVMLSGRNDGWQLALIGKNLTNELRALNAYGQPFTGFGTGTTGPSLGADVMGSVTEPRSVMLQVTLRH